MLPASGQNILIADSGPNDRKRYTVFGSRTGIEFLANVDEWHVEGTFKTAPRLFKQVIQSDSDEH